MKLYAAIYLVILHGTLFGVPMEMGDTLVIHPITWDSPSPEGWNAQYKKKVHFPDSGGPWAKIIMVQTLKCDSSTKGDTYPCGEWDYIWNTLVDVPVADSIKIFSIGSFVTPYGKRLVLGGDKGWVWSYDMTDYAPILKGLRQLTVGNNQELLDLKFLFIKGMPSRDILKVENIYPYGKYKYAELSDDAVLMKKTIHLLPQASGYKMKAIVSGHGHAGPRNCCEWDSKTHTYYLEDWELFRWNVWKDCGNNPIYPQGGTWPFDRAGWCPGTKVDEYEFELTPHVIPGDSIAIDYGIEPYSGNGEKEGFFYMTHQLFSYGLPNFKNDAEIIDIISPSKKQRYSRMNPGLTNPKILIKNTGEYDLHSLDIHYGLKKRRKSVYRWVGNLHYLEEVIIELPAPHWHGLKRSQQFEVALKNPNSMEDENILNNVLWSQIPPPKVFPEEFTLQIKTNNINRARENSFTISNMAGTVLHNRDNFKDSTEYNFQINLKRGSYSFLLKDEMEDGISVHWWNKNSAPEKIGIDGTVQFLSLDGDTLHTFDPDFGQEIQFNFHVGALP